MVLGRRRFPRLSEDVRITYRMIDQDQFQNDPVSSFAVNISGGGLCFETTEPLPRYAFLALEITASEFNSPVLALVRVIWCKAKGNIYRVGAEYWWVGWRNNDVQASLANYVATRITESEAILALSSVPSDEESESTL